MSQTAALDELERLLIEVREAIDEGLKLVDAKQPHTETTDES